jgi:hypothetical protein
MSSRMNLWGRSSHPDTDADEEGNQSSPIFRPSFRRPVRHSRHDTNADGSDQTLDNETSAEAEPPTLNPYVEERTIPVDESDRSDAPIDPLEVDRRRKPYRRVSENKARRRAMSISVSAEEERILRTHAASMDRSFSEWARSVMFRAIGRKVPSRGRGND